MKPYMVKTHSEGGLASPALPSHSPSGEVMRSNLVDAKPIFPNKTLANKWVPRGSPCLVHVAPYHMPKHATCQSQI
jgi:hypothetical protein